MTWFLLSGCIDPASAVILQSGHIFYYMEHYPIICLCFGWSVSQLAALPSDAASRLSPASLPLCAFLSPSLIPSISLIYLYFV